MIVSCRRVYPILAIASWPEVKVSRLAYSSLYHQMHHNFLIYTYTLGFFTWQWKKYMSRKYMKSTIVFNPILFNPLSATILFLLYIMNFCPLLKRWVTFFLWNGLEINYFGLCVLWSLLWLFSSAITVQKETYVIFKWMDIMIIHLFMKYQ